jgi:murein DD-endopeptidase MepM/ murein hydrolase activator NlpD
VLTEAIQQDAANLMRRAIRSRARPAAALLVLLPVLLIGIAGAPHARADDITDARARQRELHAAIQRQRAVLADLRAAEADLRSALARTGNALRDIHADQATARAEIATVSKALDRVQARHAELVSELRYLDWTLGVLQAQLDDAESDLAARQRLLAQRLTEAYATQQAGLLQQVLTAESFTDALAQFGDYLRFGGQDADLARQITRDQGVLNDLRAATAGNRYRTEQVRLEVHRQELVVAAQRARLVAAKQRLDRLANATQQLQARQTQQFSKVAQNKARAAAILRRQQAAEDRLRAQIDALVRQRGGGSGGGAGPGSLRWPMNGSISQEFGCTGFPWEAPLGGCPHFHRGIDIVAPSGTPVRAAASGTVLFVGYNPYDNPADPAWIVTIAHGGGLATWYAHLQPIRPSGISAGASVSAGEVVGYEGNTGNSTGAHLHWAVLRNGTWVNPRLYV